MISDQEVILEDWSIVAFLSLPEIQMKYHIEITPFKQSRGRVAFRIRGDVESAIVEIYANKQVGISDYMKALRNVRHTIFTLRTLNAQG